MQPHRRAVIDIGTNSVKLLVADVQDDQVIPVLEQTNQTRLGRGFYETHRLQPDAIAATARAVAEYAGVANTAHAENIRVIATSATRDALNRDELLRAIHDSCALAVEVISGEQEADWVYRGVASDPHFTARRLLILDVGGGSTEFVLGERGRQIFRESFALGSVRLLERIRPADPPTKAQFAQGHAWIKDLVHREIRPRLRSKLAIEGDDETQLVGTGGTAAILACVEHALPHFDRERIESTRLSRTRVQELTERFWSLPLSARKQIVGLPPNRADVILMGALIFQVVMEELDMPEVCVSTRGLRFGALAETKGK